MRHTGAAIAVLAGALAACGSGNPQADAKPSLSISGSTIDEGNDGVTSLEFTASLSASATDDVTVDYISADGTAKAGSDYSAVSGTFTIRAGDKDATLVVRVKGDERTESNETLTVELRNASRNVALARTLAMGIIVDDDGSEGIFLADHNVDAL